MIKVGFRYTAKYVKDRETQSGSITEFQIGDKVKNAEENGRPVYWNVRCTVWGGMKVCDGDEVVIDSIQSIEARQYNGKTYYDMGVTAHCNGQQDNRTAAQKPAGTPDESISLPFDLDLDP